MNPLNRRLISCLCLLLMTLALFISGCDDGPTQTCCYYFSESDAFITAAADPERSPRELLYIYADTVRAFAQKTDQSNAEYLSAGEYLCSVMPEMKGINHDYSANNTKDATNTCAESIPKHAGMANKIKEAWDNCCFVLGQHFIESKETACNNIDSDADPEASAKCRKELEAEPFKYLSCFRTYITQDTCEYIIN